MGNKGLPIFGIAIISFLMLGGATFGVAPTFDPALGDGTGRQTRQLAREHAHATRLAARERCQPGAGAVCENQTRVGSQNTNQVKPESGPLQY